MASRRNVGFLPWLALAFLSVAAGHAAFALPLTPAGKPLRVVLDNNYPPYVFTDGAGRPQGILVDRWRLWERKTGRRAELHPMDWGEAMRRMEAGEFDLIDTIFLTPERARRFEFSRPYAKLEVPVFFHRNITGITGAESLRGFAVGVKRGDAAVEFLKSRGVDQLLAFDSYAQIAEAARGGAVVAFVVDKPPALYYLYKLGIQDRFRFSAPLYVGEFHRAVRKGDAALLAAVEEGFSRIGPEESEAIDRRWLGSTAPEAGPDLRRLLVALGILSAAALALVAWNRTLRRSVEQRTRALRKSETRFRSLVEKAPFPVAIVDDAGRIELLNEKFTATYGYTPAELPDVDAWWPLAYPDEAYRRDARAGWRVRVDGAEGEGGEIPPMEVRVRCGDGAERTVEIFGRRIGDKLLVVLNDLTERKALEEQLLQSRKMEAIGRLAGGIAHDFNNLLTVMIGYLGLVEKRLGPGNARLPELAEVRQAAGKAADLTQQLLAFSRKQVLAPKVFDLNDAVRNAERILARLLGEDVVLEAALSPEPLPVLADAGQVGQVLVNLAVNARDAMPDGGRLTISTRRQALDAAEAAELPPLSAGPHVVLSVADTGVGIDAETIPMIFEPFFTTKAVGKGTGLGLATVYGIVAQSRGALAVESVPGRGTTFRVFLPAAAPAAAGAGAGAEETAGKPEPGRGTVLVAEDEDAVRELIESVLSEAGYRVLATRDGRDALDRCREGEAVDLLLTDVIMPGMNGRELARLVAERLPGVRVLFMSGYTDDVIGQRGVLAEGIAFLQKPFTPEALVRKVRETIDARTAEDSARTTGTGREGAWP